MLMRAITEDVELEDLEKMIRAEGLLGSDEEEDSPGAFVHSLYSYSRLPLLCDSFDVKRETVSGGGFIREHTILKQFERIHPSNLPSTSTSLSIRSVPASELWYDQNRKPLDAVQLAVKADIEFVMGLEMEHRAEKGMPISKKTIKRLARPHAPEGSTERQTIRKYHVGGPESWVKEKTAELKGVREKEEKKHELAGNFLEVRGRKELCTPNVPRHIHCCAYI